MNARSRYDELTRQRSQFLDVAVQCSKLTLPYLIRDDEGRTTNIKLPTPWQSVGSKCVVTLASKLMLALLPPQTSFFKFQVKENKVGTELPSEAKTELDISFAKMEKLVMDSIAESTDRVVVHQAIKHLIVGGNALLFMAKDEIKHYPLNRYVVERDGNGNVIEIVTKELISRKLLPEDFLKDEETVPNHPSSEGSSASDSDVEVYTHVKLVDKTWRWHQEAFDRVLPKTSGQAPRDASPWIVLRFNSVDGENYGRGRVEEFLGDFKSLEGLSQAMVEGSAAAAKVIFLVSPSSTVKPASLSNAKNGSIIPGRQDDVSVVQVGKTADFATVANQMQSLERRLSEAFLVLTVRQSERTTAEEVRLTQLELEQQLGGLFSLLTVEFLIPYLNRKLLVLQRSNELPNIPKNLVTFTIVAGINALGRGQDRESLTQFLGTIAQVMGPQALQQFVNPLEAIKRLAAAQGIDPLNLIKTIEEQQVAQDEQYNDQMAMEMAKQASDFAKAPMADPSKNPQAPEVFANVAGSAAQPPDQSQAVQTPTA